MQLKFLQSLGHQQIKYFNRNEREESAEERKVNLLYDFAFPFALLASLAF
jgi:hypothetical protein